MSSTSDPKSKSSAPEGQEAEGGPEAHSDEPEQLDLVDPMDPAEQMELAERTHAAEPMDPANPVPEVKPVPFRADEKKGAEAAGNQERELVERRVTPEVNEIELWRRGSDFEVTLDGKVIVASAGRRSERSLAELVLAPLGQRDDVSVLVAGLGMGHTLRAVLDLPGVVRVDLVEHSEAILDWNRTHLGALAKNPLDDPRVHVHAGDLLSFLKRHRTQPNADVKDGWFALVLDVDNGPSALLRSENLALYTDEGLGRMEAALRHGGVLGVWSAERDVDLLRRMHARLLNVAELAVPVDVPGSAGLDYIYRGRRPPAPRKNPRAN